MPPVASASADKIATELFNYNSADYYKVCTSDLLR